MKIALLVALLLSILSITLARRPACAAESDDSLLFSAITTIRGDYRSFYLDKTNLFHLGIGLAGAGILANTAIDQDVRDGYQEKIRSKSTDDAATLFEQAGEGMYTIPVMLGTYAIFKDSAAGKWAQRSLRAMIIGAPSELLIQRATGASSPVEGSSDWRPFKGHDGLSGNAFMGAIPFITAAQMNNTIYVKGALYTLSALPGLSRINDDQHYLSQVALGWYLAYLSCKAIKTPEEKDDYLVYLSPLDRGGIAVVFSKTF
ncbi:MAG: hypothetical protein PHY31_06660 [Smithellaceae bacterium]|nr:hypothetical protein [Smithellaceae bacterium]